MQLERIYFFSFGVVKAVTLSLLVVTLYACKAGNGEGLDANGQRINPNDSAADNLYTPVQQVFNARCIACHSGAQAPQGLILAEGQSYEALVNIPSAQQPNLMLVDPSAPEDSYLIRKILGDPSITGGQMPRNGPPFLSRDQIGTIINWIALGAPEPTPADPNAEFVADTNNFVNYSNWTAVDYSIGPTNITLAGAHAGDEFDFSRRVFANEKALMQTGETFANGSILMKEIVTHRNGMKEFAENAGLLAMVKRGQGFNTDHNGWEWFVLAEDLSIIDRGADLMGGACNNCHSAALNDTASGEFGGKDYVFVHTSEFIAEASDFQNYNTWALIDSRSDENELLDGMAHGAGENNTQRNVYKKQLYANPDTIEQGYPVGTLIVKEVVQGDTVIEITAMAKRGGTFNPQNGAWEWFMIDPTTMQFAMDTANMPARGANLMNGMCNGCHFGANTISGNGIDYVFKHDGDPFNNNGEFVAQLENFQNYRSWDLVDYTISDINPAISGGHQAQNDQYARKVYANSETMNYDGNTFPKGSIFVKEIFTWASGEFEFSPQLGLVAMAKRGENFNSENGGWEWFELENNASSIIGRGGDYRNNGCNNCHQLASTDLVFDHPAEYVADNADFADYASWTQIDERSDTNPLLGGMAHQADDPTTTRRVYKKQRYARPDDAAEGYPIGTTIVKAVSKDNAVIELTAMVKRGGEFNSDNGRWEWFMLDPNTAMIMEDNDNNFMRGANLMGGMCNSCHTQATGTSAEGKDFVFNHANDPFFDQL